ncbi:MAG: hypothetical protein JWO31_3909, partial [Phycisphaerales bacterium]|nr:hypothetical protein [Phycisphaerales bacterium]
MAANLTTTAAARHYAVLTPAERLVAMLEASARRDHAEAGRLRGACPRLDYAAPDRA